ncbi:tRNA lysidine(34) synthetase TilS [Virgibacillus sp. 179-BFC.A HS]|uniref:tRNA lysidine(34) synthetase TilS n=1 Tax=Tigheibacillus jepli TaxID=3035914 RepID=A0ABU5CCG1_9BACI|nr:tRNA lysidine(34) synthetase TilS [Virgibacillus sp. 179-BFC.A HS]MDY0404025.1 tRNA lysidine(34) synthetase TilS [Virgibacillus sp. 179-BFC.A HS]
MLNGTNGTTRIDFPNGLKIERAYGKVVCYFPAQHPAENNPYTYILTIPGQTILPDGSAIIADYVDDWHPGDDQTYIFASDDVALPLIARTRQAGDRMSWKGLAGSKKIKDIFIDAKIPLESRQTWPLIADNDGHILWLIGLKKANHEKISAKQAFIRLRYKKKTSGGK